jgi:hypothetical protein
MGCRSRRKAAIAVHKKFGVQTCELGEFAGLHPEDAQLGNDDVDKRQTCQENPPRGLGKSRRSRPLLGPMVRNGDEFLHFCHLALHL